MKNYQEKRKLIIILLFFGILLSQLVIPLVTKANSPDNYITVIVQEGDSLWTIAKQFNNNKLDIRKYIYLIQQQNGMKNSMLQPGQLIRIPLYEVY